MIMFYIPKVDFRQRSVLLSQESKRYTYTMINL